MKLTRYLFNASQGHTAYKDLWPEIKNLLLNGYRLRVVVEEEKRNNEQNAAQWPILEAFAEQLKWPVNAEMVHMTAEEWKDVLTAAFNREHVRIAKGLDGGVVMLGLRTSKFSKGRFSEWLDFLKAEAAQRGVEIHEEET